MKRTGPTNDHVRQLIRELQRISSVEKVPLWKRVAEDLLKARRQRRVVNVSLLNRAAKDNETVIVPGKVLGNGELKRKVTVVALDFSQSAKARITEAQGSCLSIREVLKSNPKGKNMRILG